MSLFPLKPTHKPVLAYYAALAQFHQDGHKTEGNTRSAFADLLKKCASPYDWHLVEEYQFKGTNKETLRADGPSSTPSPSSTAYGRPRTPPTTCKKRSNPK
jgi:hypothetical protein